MLQSLSWQHLKDDGIALDGASCGVARFAHKVRYDNPGPGVPRAAETKVVVVVGVDFSEGAAEALAVARDLTAQAHDPIRLVHVAVSGDLDDVPPAVREHWLGEAALLSSDIEERSGLPWVELVRAAVEHGARLIVVGTHGRTGFQPLRLGGTATHLALRSRTPVVLVPRLTNGPRGRVPNMEGQR
jgi:nucleotide-binding universal stress UspA family protein